MWDQPINYAIPTSAIRVFCGYNRPELSETQFFVQLGQTFMPGTPYMLRPLGLAAYLPGVVANPPLGLPHEFALICYPSPSIWRHASSETLRGRVYTQTHGGVYASPLSGASFPVYIEELPISAVDPYFLFAMDVDWQRGVTHALLGLKKDQSQTGEEFRMALRKTLTELRAALQEEGVDQVVVTARDNFAIVWFHSSRDAFPNSAEAVSQLIDRPLCVVHERVICLDEPPTLTIDRTQGFNFIFVREARYFLA